MKNNVVLEVVEKSIPLEVAFEFNPQFAKLFSDSPGVYTWSNFRENILEKAEPIKAGVKFQVFSSKLVKPANDEKIEKELPEKHLFSESEVCAVIAELIAKQPKGEDGVLDNSGYANLFYTPGWVVSVIWYLDKWVVSTWPRRDFGWGADNRVFSPAN